MEEKWRVGFCCLDTIQYRTPSSCIVMHVRVLMLGSYLKTNDRDELQGTFAYHPQSATFPSFRMAMNITGSECAERCKLGCREKYPIRCQNFFYLPNIPIPIVRFSVFKKKIKAFKSQKAKTTKILTTVIQKVPLLSIFKF